MRVVAVDKDPFAQNTLTEILATGNDIAAFDSDSGIEFVDRLNKRDEPLPAFVFVSRATRMLLRSSRNVK
jgi:hypothetical protein